MMTMMTYETFLLQFLGDAVIVGAKIEDVMVTSLSSNSRILLQSCVSLARGRKRDRDAREKEANRYLETRIRWLGDSCYKAVLETNFDLSSHRLD